MKLLQDVLADVQLSRTDAPSQVTLSERKVLKYLASILPADTEHVVDLGAGAGSSTLAIAEGLELNADFSKTPEITAYDWFSIGPGHFATTKFKSISSADDASFLEDFKHFLKPYLNQVSVRSGDIKKETWTKGPIRFLHVDLCKDLDIFNHIAREFFPHLRPGSILVHQDFSRPRLPWLHYSAGLMADYLEPMYRTGGSVFYTVLKTPDAEIIDEMCDPDMALVKRKTFAQIGIQKAKSAQQFQAEHFSCLAEYVDIYLDYWFTTRKLAKERYLSHPLLSVFRKVYPELESEIAA